MNKSRQSKVDLLLNLHLWIGERKIGWIQTCMFCSRSGTLADEVHLARLDHEP